MAVPLWEIGRLGQLLSCKEMEINQRWDGTDAAGRGCPFWDSADGRAPLEALGREFRKCTRIRKKIPLVSRSVFFGYIDFTDTADFKRKQKVPHSYSRAEENARLANGVRDDEIKKDFTAMLEQYDKSRSVALLCIEANYHNPKIS